MTITVKELVKDSEAVVLSFEQYFKNPHDEIEITDAEFIQELQSFFDFPIKNVCICFLYQIGIPEENPECMLAVYYDVPAELQSSPFYVEDFKAFKIIQME